MRRIDSGLFHRMDCRTDGDLLRFVRSGARGTGALLALGRISYRSCATNRWDRIGIWSTSLPKRPLAIGCVHGGMGLFSWANLRIGRRVACGWGSAFRGRFCRRFSQIGRRPIYTHSCRMNAQGSFEAIKVLCGERAHPDVAKLKLN